MYVCVYFMSFVLINHKILDICDHVCFLRIHWICKQVVPSSFLLPQTIDFHVMLGYIPPSGPLLAWSGPFAASSITQNSTALGGGGYLEFSMIEMSLLSRKICCPTLFPCPCQEEKSRNSATPTSPKTAPESPKEKKLPSSCCLFDVLYRGFLSSF